MRSVRHRFIVNNVKHIDNNVKVIKTYTRKKNLDNCKNNKLSS